MAINKEPKQKSNTNGATDGYWSSLYDDATSSRALTTYHHDSGPLAVTTPSQALAAAILQADTVCQLVFGGPALIVAQQVIYRGPADYIAVVSWAPSAQDIYEFDDRV